MLSFDIPKNISFFTHRVLLACRGWCSDLQLEYKQEAIHYRIGLTHYCWHGTLSNVSIHHMGVIQISKISNIINLYDIITKLTESISILHQRAVYMWDTYQDCVPGWSIHSDYFIDQYETDYFKKWNPDNVVCPERANPTFLLPGWPNQETIKDYVNFIFHNNHLELILHRLCSNDASLKWSDEMTYIGSQLDYSVPQRWSFNGVYYILKVDDKKYSLVNQRNNFSIKTSNIHNDTLSPTIKTIGDITYANILKLKQGIPVSGLDIHKNKK